MSSFQLGRPRFVTLEEAIEFHGIGIDVFGGLSGLKDRALLESAIAMPRQGFDGEYAHDYPFGMAAAYAFHVAKNHPFMDGNKRVALYCCDAFLRMNGYDLVSAGEAAADAILRLVTNEMDKAAFAGWLQAHSRPRASMELRDFFSGLTVDDLVSQYMAVVVGGEQGEPMAQTLEDAGRSVPVVARLHAQANAEYAAGQVDRGRTAMSMVFLLAAMYRIAEDMGYEW